MAAVQRHCIFRRRTAHSAQCWRARAWQTAVQCHFLDRAVQTRANYSARAQAHRCVPTANRMARNFRTNHRQLPRPATDQSEVVSRQVRQSVSSRLHFVRQLDALARRSIAAHSRSTLAASSTTRSTCRIRRIGNSNLFVGSTPQEILCLQNQNTAAIFTELCVLVSARHRTST